MVNKETTGYNCNSSYKKEMNEEHFHIRMERKYYAKRNVFTSEVVFYASVINLQFATLLTQLKTILFNNKTNEKSIPVLFRVRENLQLAHNAKKKKNKNQTNIKMKLLLY